MKTTRLFAILGIAAALAACETTTRYTPIGPQSRIGYSEVRLETNRYRVTFQGASGASGPMVNDYALMRAAELALAQGFEWFQVLDRFTETTAPTSPRFSFGVGTGSYGRSGGVGVGGSSGFGGEPSMRTTLEVFMGRGQRPTDRDTYDARDVAETLHGRLPLG